MDEKVIEKLLEDIELDDFHFIVKFGVERKDYPDN